MCQNILDNGDSPENKAFSFMGSYNDKNNDKIVVMIIIKSLNIYFVPGYVLSHIYIYMFISSS